MIRARGLVKARRPPDGPGAFAIPAPAGRIEIDQTVCVRGDTAQHFQADISPVYGDVVPAQCRKIVPGTFAKFLRAFEIVYRGCLLRQAPRVHAESAGKVSHPVALMDEPLLVQSRGLRAALLQRQGLGIGQPRLGIPQRQLVPCGLSATDASDRQFHVNAAPAVTVQHQAGRILRLMCQYKLP